MMGDKNNSEKENEMMNNAGGDYGGVKDDHEKVVEDDRDVTLADENETLLDRISTLCGVDDIEQKVIAAIGKIYITMHLINLPKNTQKEYQCNPRIRQLINERKIVSQQIQDALGGMTEGEYRKGILKFVDLGTLNKRMKNTNVISHEFYSINDRWCRANFIVVNRLEDGKIDNVIFAVQLIDEEKRRELEYQRALKLALDNQNEMYGEMLKMLGTGVVAYDVDTKRILLVNDVAKEMFGFSGEENFTNDFLALQNKVVSDNRDGFVNRFKETLAKQGSYTCEYTLDNGKRQVYILAYTKIIVLGNGQKISLSSLTDVTEKKILEEQLRDMSRTDLLTQITNRGYGELQIEELIGQGVPGMFCLFDVDKFKSINDTFGHAVGDKALCAIAECLKKRINEEDVIMRLGGDEFAVYSRGVQTEEEGGKRIDRFFRELEKIHIEEMGSSRISVSLGAVICSCAQGETFDELYQKADAAMYICKNNQGNQYAFFRPGMRPE